MATNKKNKRNDDSNNRPIPECYRLHAAIRIIKSLIGSKAEMRGQFQMVKETEEFRKKYPDEIGEDIITIIEAWLCSI